MAENTYKKERIDARLTAEQKALIQRAAALDGRSVGDFVVSAATEAARFLVEKDHVIQLSLSDQQKFADVLLDPPPLSPAMQRAIQRHAKRVRQE